MPLDLSEVANDPDLRPQVDFWIIRSQGQFAAGGWQVTKSTKILAQGVIVPASDRALQMVPEGDRVVGSLQIITTTPIYTTSDWKSGISDKVRWNGVDYRVMSVGPWQQYGFYSAILVRMKGD